MHRARAVLALAALGGAGTMIVELAAVRLLAPWYGASLVVWTNVIGVILLALSLGYLAGARASRGPEPLRSLGVVLLIAAAATALLPYLVRPVADLFLPERLALDEALPLVVWGSLATSLCLFLVPACALGMVAPLAAETLERGAGRSAGDAGGRVLFASTAGSLAGVFGTTHWLVPELGLAAAFHVAAGMLALAGAAGIVLGRGPRALLALALVPAAVALPQREVQRPTPEGWRLLAEVESRYQTVRVVEESGAAPMRHLQVNEAFDSFQSVWQPQPGLLPEGYYYNAFALPLFWGLPRESARVLVLGLGAGTVWRVLEGVAPGGLELVLEGVEIDPAVLELGEAHMDLWTDGERRIAHGGLDARVALRLEGESYDLAIVDCYANQVEIPAHLATVEFLEELGRRLVPGGWVAINVGGFGFEDPLVRAVAATAAQAFRSEALVLRVPAARNYVVFARKDAPPPVEGSVLAPVSGPAAGLLLPLELPGGFALVGPAGGRVLTDDDAPLERLQLASTREASRRLRGGSP